MTQLTTATEALAEALETILGPGAVVAAADQLRSAGMAADLTIVAENVVTLDGAYSVPPTTPLATVDVLSPAAFTLRGALELETKRVALAAAGVTLHLEINIHAGQLTLWLQQDGALVQAGSGQSFLCEALGNAVLEVPGHGVLKVFNANGELISYYDVKAAKRAKLDGFRYDAADMATEMASTVAGSLELADAVVLP